MWLCVCAHAHIERSRLEYVMNSRDFLFVYPAFSISFLAHSAHFTLSIRYAIYFLFCFSLCGLYVTWNEKEEEEENAIWCSGQNLTRRPIITLHNIYMRMCMFEFMSTVTWLLNCVCVCMYNVIFMHLICEHSLNQRWSHINIWTQKVTRATKMATLKKYKQPTSQPNKNNNKKMT